MGRLRGMRVRNYRSIGGWVDVRLPERGPLVLMGENNAGKSNLVQALDLVLGESWPGSFHPEEHDFHGRDRNAVPMQIQLDVSDVWHAGRYDSFEVRQVSWRFDPQESERPCAFDVFDANGRSSWASNADREQLACVVVGADRRLGYQLSYTSKWTLLSRLMRKFHERLVEDPERTERLRARFDEVVVIFHEVEAFQLFGRELQDMAGELAANLRYGLDLDFSAYDPSNYFRSLRVHPTHGGEVRSFDELGTGQEQILAVAFAYAYARAYGEGDGGLVIVIEEPEAHLHPLAQQWLARKIAALGDRGVQVIVTTHSPAFVDLSETSRLACVRKPSVDGATTVVQHSERSLAEHCRERGAAKADERSVGPFYAASATDQHVAGLFARACVVVEGPTEALAFPILLSAVGTDPLELGIAVIPAGGIGGIARWLRLYSAYEIPAMAIFDLDSSDDRDGLKRAELLNTLGEEPYRYQALVTAGAPIAVREGYAVFSEDFERAMRVLFPEVYAHHEEAAGAELGTTKPLVARAACRRLAGELALPGWENLKPLASAVANLVRASKPR